VSTPAGGVFPQFWQAFALGAMRVPQCMQNLCLSRKFSVIVMLFRPSASADTGTGPISVEDTSIAFSASLPFGMVTTAGSTLPFAAVTLIVVSDKADIGFPVLSSNCKVMIDFSAPFAIMLMGSAVTFSCVGAGGFLGLFSNL